MQHPIKITLGLLFTLQTLFGFDYKLTPKQVSPSVWCFFGKLEAPSKSNGGFMSNSCYIKTKKYYIVVDSGPTHQFAEQAYRAMEKIAPLPVSLVINTHYHDDHWLGNSYYKKRFNAKLIGTTLQQESYKKGDSVRIQKMTSPEIFARTVIVPLDDTVKKKQTLTIEDTKLTIIPVGTKAHTSEDLFVLLEDEKVVFSGDLVMNGRITSNRDGSVLGQLKAHEMINSTGWKALVPGHGYETGSKAMEESALYFRLLKERVGKAVEDDIGADEVTKVVTLPEFRDKAMYEIVNKRNIFDAYNELEFAEE
jgi:glyoxylase-like metal-dependent hydrolase (beta-lactamase superfamily II)